MSTEIPGDKEPNRDKNPNKNRSASSIGKTAIEKTTIKSHSRDEGAGYPSMSSDGGGEPTSSGEPSQISSGKDVEDLNPDSEDVSSISSGKKEKTPREKWGDLIDKRELTQEPKPSSSKKAPLHAKITQTELGRKDLDQEHLLTLEEKEFVQKFFQDNSAVVKLSKKAAINALGHKIAFSVVKGTDGKGGDALYALYRGKTKALGEGAYGRVKIAQNIMTGEWVAVKIQKISLNDPNEKLKLETEALAERAVGVSERGMTAFNVKKKEEDKEKGGYVKGYIFLKLLEGKPLNRQLQSYTEDVQAINRMRKKEGLDPIKMSDSELITNPSEKLEVAILALEELKKMHDKEVISRDIKPGNIMYDRKNKKLTLIDMGLAKNLKTEGKIDPVTNEFVYSDFVAIGTLSYMSPEIKDVLKDKPTSKWEALKIDKTGTKIYSKKSDMYAMGTLLKEDMKILADQKHFTTVYQRDLQTLVDSMTDPDAAKRPTVEAAIETLKTIQKAQLVVAQKERNKLNRFLENYKDINKKIERLKKDSWVSFNLFERDEDKKYKEDAIRLIQVRVDSIRNKIKSNQSPDSDELGKLSRCLKEVKVKLEKENYSSNRNHLYALCKDMLKELDQLNQAILRQTYSVSQVTEAVIAREPQQKSSTKAIPFATSSTVSIANVTGDLQSKPDNLKKPGVIAHQYNHAVQRKTQGVPSPEISSPLAKRGHSKEPSTPLKTSLMEDDGHPTPRNRR